MPEAVYTRVLHHCHYAKPSRHPGGMRPYHFLRRSFDWSFMSVDSYLTVRNCITCARSRANLRRHNGFLKILPALTPLEFVAINFLGELVTTLQNNKYILATSDSFSQLVRTVPLRSVTVESVAKAFVTHWVLDYGPIQ